MGQQLGALMHTHQWRVKKSVSPVTWKHLKKQQGVSSWTLENIVEKAAISDPTSRDQDQVLIQTISGMLQRHYQRTLNRKKKLNIGTPKGPPAAIRY